MANAAAGLFREPLEGRDRLLRVERDLIWVRRSVMAMWLVALLCAPPGAFAEATPYLIVAGVAYMEGLHLYSRRSRNLVELTRLTALGDSLLAFTMAWTAGGSASSFAPLFYFTIVAAAFRFGALMSFAILVVNAVLYLTLVWLDLAAHKTPGDAPFALLYMVIAFVLGAMLSNWAAANLTMALNRAVQLSAERDRSLSLLRKLINAQEEERRLLSEDLHDRLGESLFTIGHQLDACIANSTPDQARQLGGARQKLSAFSSDLRYFINELRPNVLDELGLYEATMEYVASLRTLAPFTVHVNFDAALLEWKSRQDAMVFRLIQEAIFNARKHSGAKRVDISLRLNGIGPRLSVCDDGCGFDVDAVPPGHFGLIMMRERAQVSGGVFELSSAPGRGTCVVVQYENEAHGCH